MTKYLLTLLVTLSLSMTNAQDASWMNLFGLQVSSTDICKNLSDGWGNSGGFSLEVIPDGEQGHVEMVSDGNSGVAIGLSSTDSDQNYTSIEYCFVFSSSGLIIYESGVGVVGSFGSYRPGDVMMIERKSGKIHYSVNGANLISSTDNGGDLHMDFALDDSLRCMYDITLEMKEPYPLYYECSREPSASYTRTFGFNLMIYYQEEYLLNDGKEFSYEIYDKDHQVVASIAEDGTAFPGSSPTQSVQYYDNKINLNLRTLGLVVGEVYTVQVTNRKHQKRYVKFIYESDMPN